LDTGIASVPEKGQLLLNPPLLAFDQIIDLLLRELKGERHTYPQIFIHRNAGTFDPSPLYGYAVRPNYLNTIVFHRIKSSRARSYEQPLSTR
jgi:hypothetical protein